MEILILHLIMGLDRWLRPRIDQIIPNRSAITADPAGFFEQEEGIYVGPRRYPVGSIVAGIPLGCLFGWLFTLLLEAAFGVNRQTGLTTVAMIGAALVTPAVLWHLTRGGELHLVSSGVVFAYRGSDVLCPWVSLQPYIPPHFRDDSWIGLSLHPLYLDRITQTRAGEIVRTGQKVHCSHIQFERPGFFGRVLRERAKPPLMVLVRDVYAVRPEELFPFLLHVARLMRDESTIPLPFFDDDEPDDDDCVYP